MMVGGFWFGFGVCGVLVLMGWDGIQQTVPFDYDNYSISLAT